MLHVSVVAGLLHQIRLDYITFLSQCNVQFFLSLRVNSCADLFVPDPLSCVCTARTQSHAHVRDPIPICRKRVGLTAGSMETRKQCTQEGGGEGEAGRRRTMAARFQPAFPVRALHRDNKVT